MKLFRYGPVATATLAGALALTACGTDDNTTAAGSARNAAGGAASGAASAAASAASSAAAGAGSAASGSGSSGAASGSGSTGSAGATGSGANCPAGGATLNAEGSSAQQNAVTAWSNAFQSQCSGVTVNYNPTGSGAGIKSFIDGKVPLAGSDSALKPDEASKANARCKTGKAINLPMVVGPIAVAYNLEGVEDLQLKPATIAGIFAGKIKNWNDPAIAADNPDATLPDTPIQAFYRSDESGTTENFQKYLKAAAPSVWTFEPAKSWPSGASGGQGAVKSAGVADAVKRGSGTIGYMEQSFATNSELNVAKLGVGSEFVELSNDTAGAAVESAKTKGQGNDLALELDYASTKSGTYPLILVTYEITCEKGLPADQASLVKSFLTYTASKDGQDAIAGEGYAPLPDSVQQKVAKAVASIS